VVRNFKRVAGFGALIQHCRGHTCKSCTIHWICCCATFQNQLDLYNRKFVVADNHDFEAIRQRLPLNSWKNNLWVSFWFWLDV
jgi:hypothetical protein